MGNLVWQPSLWDAPHLASQSNSYNKARSWFIVALMRRWIPKISLLLSPGVSNSARSLLSVTWAIFFSLFFFAVACNLSGPGVVADFDGFTASIPIDDRRIETFAAPLVVAAGETVTASCVVWRRDRHLDQVPTTIEIAPNPGPIEQIGNGTFKFRPSRAGAYRLECADSVARTQDLRGVKVTVVPGTPEAVETIVDNSVVPAGMPLTIDCDIYDGFNNLVVDLEATGVVADPSMLCAPPLGGRFVVRGTVVGDFAVACQFGSVMDITPESVSVIVGPPGGSDTVVDVSTTLPNEAVRVTCVATDAFGNPLADVPTEFIVMAADGKVGEEAGVMVTGNTFAAQNLGTYYVFCRVPGMLAGDETPAVVNVRRGRPCIWDTGFIEEQCYWRGRRLPNVPLLLDRWGYEIDGVAINMESTPATGVVNDAPGSWVFNNEGEFSLSFSVVGDVDAECAGDLDYAGLPVVVDVVVDSTGPVFTVAPRRAAMVAVGTATDRSVTLTGTLTDAVSNVANASVAGVDLGADSSQRSISISVAHNSRWGLSIIDGVAVDVCGNQAVLAQSYLRSGDTGSTRYFTAATTPNVASRADQGAVAQLNQELLDDNDVFVDDLASIGEAVLQAQNYDNIIAPGYVFVSSDYGVSCSGNETGYRLRRPPTSPPAIEIEGPYITELRAVDGGLEIAVHVGDSNTGYALDFPLEVWGRQCLLGTEILFIDSTAWVHADAIDLTGPVGVGLSGNSPSITLSSLEIATTGLSVEVDCPDGSQALCDWLVNTFVTLLTTTIEDALEDAIAEQLPPIIDDFLSGFAFDSSFAIPAPLSMQVQLASGFDRIAFCGPTVSGLSKPSECPATGPNPGYGQLGLFAQVYPSTRGTNIAVSASGAIKKSGALPTFANSGYQCGLGLKDDLLNQALWAVWYGGGLDLDVSAVSEIIGTSHDGVLLSLFFETPPVIMPGRDGWELQVGVGDVYIEATVDLGAVLGGTSSGSLNLALYLSAVVGGSIDVNGGELILTLETEPDVHLEVITIDDPGYQASMSEVFSGLARLVLPRILGSVLQSFPIPEIDLAGVLGIVCNGDGDCPLGWTCEPAGGSNECSKVLSLSESSVDRTSDYTRLTGSLE